MSDFEPGLIPWRNQEDEEEDLEAYKEDTLESFNGKDQLSTSKSTNYPKDFTGDKKVKEHVISCFKNNEPLNTCQNEIISCRHLIIGIGSAANFLSSQKDIVKDENYIGFITTNKLSFKANTLSPTFYNNKGCHFFRVPETEDLYAISYDNIADNIVSEWCFQLFNKVEVIGMVMVLDVLRFGQLKTGHINTFEDDVYNGNAPLRYLSTTEARKNLITALKMEEGSFQSLEEANLIGGIGGGIISYCEVVNKRAVTLLGFCSLRAARTDHLSVYKCFVKAVSSMTEMEILFTFGQEEVIYTEKHLQKECDYYNHTASSIYT